MTACFEFIDKYKECGLSLPVRETQHSAGYDLAAAEDIVIPALDKQMGDLLPFADAAPFTLSDVAALTSAVGARPTLVPTGVKCKLNPGSYLKLVVRSSTPLKHWLIMANAVGRLLG